MQVHYREYRIQPRSRAGTVALAAGVIVVGTALVIVGATLLLALGAVGAVAGAGALAWRRLAGRGAPRPPEPLARQALDPRLEVFAPDEHRLPGAGDRP